MRGGGKDRGNEKGECRMFLYIQKYYFHDRVKCIRVYGILVTLFSSCIRLPRGRWAFTEDQLDDELQVG